MSHPASPEWPTVLLVAEDRALLRRLSRFLQTFGYLVQQAAEMQRLPALLEIEPPQLMIVDTGKSSRRALDLCRKVSAAGRTAGIHLLLLVEHQAELDVAGALEAGVHDFLAKPVVYGELLARLRAGFRAWQFEERTRRQHPYDPISGLPAPAALYQRLQDCAGHSAVACVVLGLDFFRAVTTIHGRQAGHDVLRQVAEVLRAACDAPRFLAALGGDRFGCLLPGSSARDAADWAENVRRALAETEFSWQDAPLSLSASFGVAATDTAGSPDGLLARAGDALRRAKQSGRNCVVRHGEFQDEELAWTELAAPGKIFERTVARDVMLPCPLRLDQNEPLAAAAQLLRQTKLELLPIVDESGGCLGALTSEELLQQPALGDESVAVGQVASGNLPTLDAETPFAAVLEFFARDGGSVALVVDQNRPIGSLSAASLAGLTCPPERLRADEPYFGSDYLLVPESCGSAG